jgi:hypothetical protein
MRVKPRSSGAGKENAEILGDLFGRQGGLLLLDVQLPQLRAKSLAKSVRVLTEMLRKSSNIFVVEACTRKYNVSHATAASLQVRDPAERRGVVDVCIEDRHDSFVRVR